MFLKWYQYIYIYIYIYIALSMRQKLKFVSLEIEFVCPNRINPQKVPLSMSFFKIPVFLKLFLSFLTMKLTKLLWETWKCTLNSLIALVIQANIVMDQVKTLFINKLLQLHQVIFQFLWRLICHESENMLIF